MHTVVRRFTPLLLAAFLAVTAHSAMAQEPLACLSTDAKLFPATAKPYFLVIADSSASMTTALGSANSCGTPASRLGQMVCGLRTAFTTLAGPANFGLAIFAAKATGCDAACTTCTYSSSLGDSSGGCGQETESLPNSAGRASATIVVPIRSQDSGVFNTSDLLAWVDGSCSGNRELFAYGNSPVNGALRDAFRYLSSSWTALDGSVTYTTPLQSGYDLACRSVNVILITDSNENCDIASDALDAAADLYYGLTVGSNFYKVKVHVINLGGASSQADGLAAAGGTATAYTANDASQVAAAMRTIVLSTLPTDEVCDNVDNNCNGCTDEGFNHYCNTGNTCCAWSNTTQRTTCLNTYLATITASNPSGDRTRLPCTTVAQAALPAQWLCYNPGETCDNADNNCNGQVDETFTKCGTPPHCPTTEICDLLDNDCDGQFNEGVCTGCIPTIEVCDGCDNDCDGIADEGIATQPCGLDSPANCHGNRACSVGMVEQPGGCLPNGGWGACAVSPQAEICDAIDNDCDGWIDDNVAPSPCIPAGYPPGLVYGGNSQCKKGLNYCNFPICQGFVGPSAEVCDGIDNNCDGVVDNNIAQVGTPCGLDHPPCVRGLTACVNGSLVCKGGLQPQPEVCDGIDNNCDGTIDELPLADAPPQGNNGCWTLPGNCCMFGNATWCPPPGASCFSAGTLAPPCMAGSLVCHGIAGFQCEGGRYPTQESCNGRDDDCNGIPDDGPLAGTGEPCGTDQGECTTGTTQCESGRMRCSGNAPAEEVCDGLDNDCDGATDQGLSSEGACTLPFDTDAYPGDRSQGVCHSGLFLCNSEGPLCVGAVAPSPELCDGIDNDCDGTVDEAEEQPEGVLGSTAADSNRIVGSPCDPTQGGCQSGTWVCSQGRVVCDATPAIERCDGVDNDCDGSVDEAPGEGEAPLCAEGSVCVRHNDIVRCSQPCVESLPHCPGSQDCVSVEASFDGSTLPDGCLPRALLLAPRPLAGPRARPLVRTAPAAAQPSAQAANQEESESAQAALEAPLPREDAASESSGCTTSSTGSPASLLLVVLALGLLVALRRARPQALALFLLSLMVYGPMACSSSEQGHIVTADQRSEQDLQDSQGDAILPDAPGDTQKPDIGDDSLVPDGSGDADDATDSGDAGDMGQQDGDLQQCPEADLHSPENCGACDHNCLDDVPPHVNAQTVVCDWSGDPQEAGECLFPDCVSGWHNVDPALPGCEYPCTTTGSAEDVCNKVDDDCDGEVDELVDFCSVEHCGNCDTVCQGDNATYACDAGLNECGKALCKIVKCSDDYYDIDLDWETGCEYPCVPTSQLEEVCDGVDDNCDGHVDETFVFSSPMFCGTCDNNCYEALPNADIPSVVCTWSGVEGEPGVCSFTDCARNYWDLNPAAPGCEYYCVQTALTDERCDSYDDDCDGVPDEEADLCSVDHCGQCGISCIPGSHVSDVACQSNDSEECAPSAACVVTSCDDGFYDLDKRFDNGCEYACQLTGEELCNGLDDDCDGLVDYLPHDAALGSVCTGGDLGVCATPEHTGLVECTDGTLVCTGPDLVRPAQRLELCNGTDDDCDGLVDEFPTDVGTPCGESGIFPCVLGTYACSEGQLLCMGDVGPSQEVCNGQDDDCDGSIDFADGVPPAPVGETCAVAPAAPEGATSPCKAGVYACVAGSITCSGATGPTATVDGCGQDSNCDGLLTHQPNLNTDVHNCGECGLDCYTGTSHTLWQCTDGLCSMSGCQEGYYDLNGNAICEYACTFTSIYEVCNGVDDNCNGVVDENVAPVSPVFACGVSPLATGPECTSLVQVECVDGAWQCTFGAGNCFPTCPLAEELCDDMDNNCNGVLNENILGFGSPCFSDDGLPAPGHGACRTAGTMVCNGTNSVVCSATKADCANVPNGCTEYCDGIDNDCDGSVDESFIAKGTNSAYFVKPAVTRINTSLWIYSYEASRPNATSATSGTGNGYQTSAPAGIPLGKTPVCSVQGRLPWHSVSGNEASQACTAMGGHVCTLAEWQTACRTAATTPCTWGYKSLCTNEHSSSKFCNLGFNYDTDTSVPGNQDALLPTGSSLLMECSANFTGVYGNTAATAQVFDITGNLAELSLSATDTYAQMGGHYQTGAEAAASCEATSITGSGTYKSGLLGFRCCFTNDPTL